MAAQVAGKTELVDVVTAISAAEASLETVMAVRDQVISRVSGNHADADLGPFPPSWGG